MRYALYILVVALIVAAFVMWMAYSIFGPGGALRMLPFDPSVR